MVESDRMDRMEEGLHGVEKALVRLTVIAEEGAKREERLTQRMDDMEKRVEENARMLWKFLGGITVATFLASLFIGFL